MSAIGKFNKWAEGAGAIWSRQSSVGRANLIETAKDGYDYARELLKMYRLQEMKHIYR